MSDTKRQSGEQAATIPDFAVAAGVSTRTVNRLIAAEQIRSVKIGSARRIPWSELPRLFRRREVSTHAEHAA